MLSTDGTRARERPSRGMAALAALLFVAGFAWRVAPLVAGGERLFTQFPSEDAYLMLTVARNLALGLGMTTAEGMIPTNGVQPLTTLLWAAVFLLADADRELGVRIVLMLEVVFSSLLPVALFYFGRRVLRGRPYAASASLLASAVWYASPSILPLSMNCQETVLYALATVVVAHGLLGVDETWSAPRMSLVGLLLGLVFWIRNDAVFLIASVCVVYVLSGGEASRAGVRRRLFQAACALAASGLMALPWLLYNYQEFGSIVPISGTSQTLGREASRNLARLPAVLAQYLFVVVPIPTPRESSPLVLLVGTVAALAGGLHYVRSWRGAARDERRMLMLVSLLGLALCVYYTGFFGAPYFLKRYLFPLSPFLALGAGATALGILHSPRLAERRRLVLPLAGAALLAVLSSFGIPGYRQDSSGNHWDKVEWVAANVSSEEWVGAIQSGMLGFFHPRTLNLDGKVNPAALHALTEGTYSAYVIHSPVEWLVGWPQILGRVGKRPAIRRVFEVVVDDPARRLFVLRRRAPGEAARS